jgi:SnoaL-like domain
MRKEAMDMSEGARKEAMDMSERASNDTEATRAVIAGFYSEVSSSSESIFDKYIDPEIVFEAPGWLPIGGVHHGIDVFVNTIMPGAAALVDTSSVRVESVVADGDIAVVFLRSKLIGTGEEILVIEDFRVRDGKVTFLRLSHHDARPLMALLARADST